MKHIFFPAIIAVGSGLVALSSQAQEVDNTQTLPDAKPGECYAKVITPAEFSTRTEEVVVQEASERIETIAAKYESAEETLVIKEASQRIEVVPAEFADDFERVEIRPAETNWTIKAGNKQQPASPGALEGIVRSGVDLEGVEAGTCFSEFFTQPEYKVSTKRVLKKEGIEVISAVAAEYETVEERVTIKEASSQVIDVPAVYRTETQSVLVEPARSVWKAGRGPVERIDNTTGEIMCLIEVPARYETITKTVLDKPATTKTVSVPAVHKIIKVQRLLKPASESREGVDAIYAAVTTREKTADAGFFWLKTGEAANADAEASGREVCLTQRDAEFTTIKKQVVKTPAKVESANIPARYRTIKVERLVSPASERRIPIPERTKTVTRQVQISPSRLEWRRILCETNMTPKIITSLQRALKREGYNPGPIDGVVGKGTMEAIEKYQIKKQLDRGGLTYETLKDLKVQS